MDKEGLCSGAILMALVSILPIPKYCWSSATTRKLLSPWSSNPKPRTWILRFSVSLHNSSTGRRGTQKLKRNLISGIASAAAGEGRCGFERKAYDALLVDAAGTLLQLASPVEETYASIGSKYGLNATVSEIKRGFKRAFAAQWPKNIRYQGDGRSFWRLVVSEATGCKSNDYFEEVYEYFANGDAWRLPSGAYETILHLKDAGVKLAVVSNFDTRLRKLLKDLGVSHLFDAIIISAEVGYEKPAVEIFRAALDQIGVDANRALHVGDDVKADKMGANAAGIDCLLWGSDVKTFAELHDRILIPDPST